MYWFNSLAWGMYVLANRDLTCHTMRRLSAFSKRQQSLMYGISYHLDPQVVTVGGRDTVLANAINDIQSFWYDTDLETFAEMSSDEVFFKLNAIADDNITNAVQLSIVENYHIFLSSSMFGEQKIKRPATGKNRC